MEVKAGYKQTEVGVIPEDWKVSQLQDLTPKSTSITYGVLKPGDYIPNGIPLLQIQDVIYGEIKVDELHRISSYLDRQYLRTKLFGGEIVISLIGTVGKIAFIPRTLAGANIHRNLARIRISNEHCSKYVFHYLKSEQVQQAIKLSTFGSTQALFNLYDLRTLSIAIPSYSEQEAIAESLSDADALIEALEQLLAKKRQVKQGAMQELLTGKRRLPGFEKRQGYKQTEVGIIPEDWDAVSILEMCDNKKGSIKIGPFGSQLKREYLVSSGYKIYGQENVYAQDIEIGDRYLTKEHFLKLKSCELLPGDFIVSMMGTIGQCMIVPDGIQQGIIDSHLIRIRLNPKVVLPRYLSYYYSSKLVFDQISRLQVGGIMAGLSSSIIKQIYIGLPNSTKEQTAIAEILSDMDAEITALEGKLSKARQVKQGMMQELLTGRVRLV